MAAIYDVQQQVRIEDWPKLSNVQFLLQVYVNIMTANCDFW